ncbi:MAG: DUF4124 domain-containing protein [Ruminobacter sp.]|uniref:DUF4124 domain-containing protein n=1 Tax=Ruminobacter amylophilus TaxID=867 RepID=A0A662ZIC7_9GAMM|nr:MULTISPECIES: DUF4124 domain-containing protein [Ruminobacter]MBQ3775336.1 DUF4124 domain-containing protein [Ruminobacter sp.]SFP52626.1 protein of unknown function [Ruminobacter amylophilus]
MNLTKIIIFSCVLLGISCVQAEDVYKWVDSNGVTHYGDNPQNSNKKATMVNVQTPKLGNVSVQSSSSTSYTPQRPPVRADFGNQNLNYNISISSPSNGEEIRANNGTIVVSANVTPKPQGNYAIRVFIDNSLYASSSNTQRVEVEGVPRGEHTIMVKLQTQDGKIIASEPINVVVLRVVAKK